MSSFDIKLFKTYSEILSKFYVSLSTTPSSELFGWESEMSQTKRFDIFIEEIFSHFSINKDTIISDVGCGHAALYTRLRTQGVECVYRGYDSSHTFIKECRSRYPNIFFDIYDVLLSKESLKSCDIVCMSGVLNLNINSYIDVEQYRDKDANYVILLSVLQKLLPSCKIGIVINLLHERSKNKDAFFSYYNPHSLAHNLERDGVGILGIREDYLDNDFTLTIASHGNAR